ncbi:YraN family protein [Anaeromassilibacillus senegalensis]|uniref:YraN family protein n=1 Tax=Anaeromassilibacillus senegalensis TaxID=1673717 RepID=UPI00093BAB97|nr:YraN family protein [Anaeromassilibacillus senegalensis]
MRHLSGRDAEDRAAAYLEAKGFRILERNYHSRFGEIDIIAEDGRYIVFAEVKGRTPSAYACPAEAVTPAKQRKIIYTALMYLQARPTDLQPRFDVIGILAGEPEPLLEHLENAFSGGGYG